MVRLDGERMEKIDRAIGHLESISHMDCCGSMAADEGKECDCDRCVAKRAIAILEEAIEPRHQGLHPNRLLSDPERIYFEEWCKANERVPFVNSGFNTLEWILCPSEQRTPDRVGDRDAQVAATLIQWLGTNCGRCFIEKCEQRIRREQDFRGAIEGKALNLCWKEPSPEDPVARAARLVSCEAFLSGTREQKHLEDRIRGAFLAIQSGKLCDPAEPNPFSDLPIAV